MRLEEPEIRSEGEDTELEFQVWNFIYWETSICCNKYSLEHQCSKCGLGTPRGPQDHFGSP